jgi:hypothetical protein
MAEHPAQPCSKGCPLRGIIGVGLDYTGIEKATAAGIAHFKDLVRADALGYLCGQFEPHGHFFTNDHKYVVIDNELMFSGIGSLSGCRWHETEAARPLIIEVCRSFLSIGERELECIATIPNGFVVSGGYDLISILRDARSAASEYLELFDSFQ